MTLKFNIIVYIITYSFNFQWFCFSPHFQVFWSYIVGMLTNLGSLPLERIHSMLKMFAMQGPSGSELTEHELRQFLDRKVREQLLVYAAGVYRVPKGGS